MLKLNLILFHFCSFCSDFNLGNIHIGAQTAPSGTSQEVRFDYPIKKARVLDILEFSKWATERRRKKSYVLSLGVPWSSALSHIGNRKSGSSYNGNLVHPSRSSQESVEYYSMFCCAGPALLVHTNLADLAHVGIPIHCATWTLTLRPANKMYTVSLGVSSGLRVKIAKKMVYASLEFFNSTSVPYTRASYSSTVSTTP